MAPLRRIWSQVVVAMVLLAVVVGFALPWTAEDPDAAISPAAVAVGALVLAAIGIGGAWWVRKGDYPCAPAGELQGLFATRMFMGIAISDMPALLAFVAAFSLREGWLYLVGLVIALIGLTMTAPSRANIQRVDAKLRAQGCPHALSELL